MKLFFEYLKAHIRAILLFVVFCGISAVIFSLYGLPAAAVGYSGAVCGFILAVFAVIDFCAFRKKHILMEHLRSEIYFTLDDLPAADSLTEKDYEELIRILFEEKQRLENSMNDKYAEMNGYYTLWVHQVKTPIAAMRLILQGSGTEESRLLSEDLQRIEQYVEMALCYPRLDGGGSDFLIKHYDLDGIIKQAVKKFSTRFIGRKTSLIYEPVNMEVLTDEKWLLFVIEQVISNALKYTKGGSIEIYAEEPKTLCIKDTGIGIAPEDLPRIFEKGFTGQCGRADKSASGIGLYLCRRICGKLGHTISAESEIGKGTTIKIGLSEGKAVIE